MKKVEGSEHSITGVELRELEYKKLDGDQKVMKIHLAYIHNSGFSCGKLTVERFSPKALEHLSALVKVLEEDAAKAIFPGIEDEDESSPDLEQI